MTAIFYLQFGLIIACYFNRYNFYQNTLKSTIICQESNVSSIKFPKNIANVFVKLITSTLFMMHLSTYAIEPSIQIHKADQAGSYGVSLGIGDNFFNQQAVNWAISYNRLQDIKVTWNDDEIDFSVDTLDLMLSYRYYPKSYNRFIKSLIFEFQAGVGVALTENKFLWPTLEQEKFYSEQGDVNGVLSMLVHKNLTKEVSMHIGVKHYPDYSEFGDISSLFVGFSYRFGHKAGY